MRFKMKLNYQYVLTVLLTQEVTLPSDADSCMDLFNVPALAEKRLFTLIEHKYLPQL